MANTSTFSPSTDTLATALDPLRRRMTRAWAQRLGARGALVGAVLCLLLAGLAHFRVLPDTFPLALAIAVMLLLGTGIGLLVALSHPLTILQAARLAEARGELKERLSSALLLTGGSAELLRLQQDDAVFHARQINPVQTVPLRWPPEAKALLIVLAALALLLWLPTLPAFLSPAERTERAIVQKEGAKLIKQGRVVEKQGVAQGLKQTQQAGQKMQKLGRQMADGKMDKRQALAQSASLSKQLTDAQKQAAGQQTSEKTAAGQAASSALSEQMQKQAKQTAGQSPAQAKASAGQAQKLADQTPASAPQTKAHAQTAANAQKRGDPSGAAKEWQKAADAAKREGAGGQKLPSSPSQQQAQNDAQGVQQAQKQVDGARQEVAQASKPQDVSDKPQPQSGQPQSKQQGQQQGQKPQSGQQGKVGQGTKPGTQGQPKSGQGQQQGKPGQQGTQGQQPGQNGKPGQGQQQGQKFGGSSKDSSTSQQSGQQPGTEHGAGGPAQKKPHPLNPAFKPSANPGYGKVYLGQGVGKGGGKTVQAKPGQAVSQTSTVPISQVAPQFKKGAESAMDREDVPPAYKDNVRDYFNSLGGK